LLEKEKEEILNQAKKSFEKELEKKALQVADLEKEVARLKVLLENRPLLEYSQVCEKPAHLAFWTGLPSREAFEEEYRGCEEYLKGVNFRTGEAKKRSHQTKTEPRQMFFWFLVRLRRGFPYDALAYLFNTDSSTLCRAIPLIAEYVAYKNHKSLRILHGKELEEKTPKWVLSRHPETEVHNTDATYFEIQKSQNLNLQRETYSSYKGYNLLKVVAITTTDGTFEGYFLHPLSFLPSRFLRDFFFFFFFCHIALSFPFPGGKSDQSIWNNAGMNDFFDFYLENPHIRVNLNVDKGMGIVPPNPQEEEKGKGKGKGKGQRQEKPEDEHEDDQAQQEEGRELEEDQEEEQQEKEEMEQDLSDLEEDLRKNKEKGKGNEKIEKVAGNIHVMEPTKKPNAVEIASERISIEQSFGRVKNAYKLLQQSQTISSIEELYFFLVVACCFCNKYMKGFNHKTEKNQEMDWN